MFLAGIIRIGYLEVLLQYIFILALYNSALLKIFYFTCLIVEYCMLPWSMPDSYLLKIFKQKDGHMSELIYLGFPALADGLTRYPLRSFDSMILCS